MRQMLIKGANCALLIIALIGIPAITSAGFGSLRIASAPTQRMLILWTLSLAAGLNLLAAMGVMGDARGRRLCRDWAAAFLGLLCVEWGYFHGYLSFHWLKQALLWLKRRV
jgi:hypothetical protein